MRTHQHLFAFALITLLSTFGVAFAQAPTEVTSAEFAKSASEHLTTQLAAARAAQAKSQDAAVKRFAAELADDYRQAGSALAKICEELNIDLLPEPGTGQGVAGAAATTPESSFDQVYTLELAQSLAKAETSFDTALRSPKVDPKLKEFAKQRLEATRKYRQLAAPLARAASGTTGR